MPKLDPDHKIVIHVTPEHPAYKQIEKILKSVYQRMKAAEQFQQANVK